MKTMKYSGVEERKVFLRRTEHIVRKGSEFQVTDNEAKKFKDKKDFNIKKSKLKVNK